MSDCVATLVGGAAKSLVLAVFAAVVGCLLAAVLLACFRTAGAPQHLRAGRWLGGMSLGLALVQFCLSFRAEVLGSGRATQMDMVAAALIPGALAAWLGLAGTRALLGLAGSKSLTAWLGIVLVLTVLGWQATVDSNERLLLAKELATLRADAQTASVVERHRDEFQREVLILERKRADLDAVLPETLKTTELRRHLERRAKSLGIELRNLELRPKRVRPLYESQVGVVARGSAQALAALRGEVQKWTPIATWHAEPAEGDTLRVVLTTYARPEQLAQTRGPCTRSDPGPLPIALDVTRRMQREKRQLCAERDAPGSTQSQLAAFEHSREEVRERLAAIDKLRSESAR